MKHIRINTSNSLIELTVITTSQSEFTYVVQLHVLSEGVFVVIPTIVSHTWNNYNLLVELQPWGVQQQGQSSLSVYEQFDHLFLMAFYSQSLYCTHSKEHWEHAVLLLIIIFGDSEEIISSTPSVLLWWSRAVSCAHGWCPVADVCRRTSGITVVLSRALWKDGVLSHVVQYKGETFEFLWVSLWC